MAILPLLVVLAQQPPAPPAMETLRARLEQIHDVEGAAVRGARLLQADVVVHFFEKRSFEPAWALPADAEQIREAIFAVELDGLTPSHYHLAAIEALLAARRSSPSRALDDDLQILLTDAVASLLDHVRYGKVVPSSLDRRWNVDPRAGVPPLGSLLEEVASAPSPRAAIDTLKPNHFIYTGLKDALARMRAAQAAGGWPAVPAGGPLKPGASDPRVAALRARLAATGELPREAATHGGYDDAVTAAVKQFQDNHRLTPDGVVGAATLRELNVGAGARAQQIRVNLERIRWVIGGLQDSFVLVNLPSFKVYIIRDRKNVWESRTVIGQTARQTPTFRADMKYLVLNPDWTVPPTILAQDVLAPMRRGVNAVARKGLTILDRQGRRVDPSSINWSAATPRNFPYTLRQPPGPNNALGRVKFVFPNEHTVFLHDTPSQDLFSSDQRTFSSGCIRVEHALDLAELLLAPQGWTPERIQEAIESGKTETVFLEHPLPILIVYWTVSVGSTGLLRFARDVYNRDPGLLKALG
jgi:murein L,D-transpeptidase YcbB/YkuD